MNASRALLQGHMKKYETCNRICTQINIQMKDCDILKKKKIVIFFSNNKVFCEVE